MPSVIEFELAGLPAMLSPERAVYFPHNQTAIIADPHFGKAASFRAGGIPVPRGTTAANLSRVDRVLESFDVRRLLVLGDFFHARAGRSQRTLATIAAWRASHARLEITLVRGNHDRAAGDPPAEWNIACHAGPLCEAPFAYCHEPCEQDGLYVLCGHVHPAVLLKDGAGVLRAACFWFGARTGVLPAFGSFTGAYRVRPVEGDRVFVVGPDAVVDVSGARPARC